MARDHRGFSEAAFAAGFCAYGRMLTRAFVGFVVLGAAVATAMVFHWMLIEGLGFEARDVFQGVTIAAALIGVAYLADVIPRPQ
jgi:hypothetical protein